MECEILYILKGFLVGLAFLGVQGWVHQETKCCMDFARQKMKFHFLVLKHKIYQEISFVTEIYIFFRITINLTTHRTFRISLIIKCKHFLCFLIKNVHLTSIQRESNKSNANNSQHVKSQTVYKTGHYIKLSLIRFGPFVEKHFSFKI